LNKLSSGYECYHGIEVWGWVLSEPEVGHTSSDIFYCW